MSQEQPPTMENVDSPEPISLEKTKNENKVLLLSLILLLIVATLLVLVKFLSVSSKQDFDSFDSAGYLDNGAFFAGFSRYGQVYQDTFPPINSLLLAALFKISGQPNLLDGYLLSAILYFVSMLSCFFISKRIMSPQMAVIASVSFGIVPSVFQWAGIMMTNVEAVAFASASIVALILASTVNRKLFLVAFPLAAIAVLTRLTMGIVIPVFIVYLVANWKITKSAWKYVFGGLILCFLTAITVGFPWYDYAIVNHLSIGSLLPLPNLSYGSGTPFVYIINFPQELGQGLWGYVLAISFVSSLVLVSAMILKHRYSKIDPVVYVMITWFSLSFLYYYLIWPDKLDWARYSIDFAMPAIILGCWFFSGLVNKIYSFARSKRTASGTILAVSILIGMILFVGVSVTVSGQNVVQSTYDPLGGDQYVNVVMGQAAVWLTHNVPTNSPVGTNMMQLLVWYAPAYRAVNILGYNLASQAEYGPLKTALSNEHVGYLVVCPHCAYGFSAIASNTTVWNSLNIKPVWTSSSASIIIFAYNQTDG